MESSPVYFLISFSKRLSERLRAIYRKILQSLRTRSVKRRRLTPGTYIARSAQVLGWDQVHIGEGSIISEDTWINVNHRQVKSDAISIGKSCFIGRRNFLSSGKFIKIGDYCLTGPNCSFLGADHIYTSPFVPYITSGVTHDETIEIGANCWLGANVTILKGVKVGYGSIIGTATVVTRDIPPLSIVVGNPGRVIKRFDPKKQAWVRVDNNSNNNIQNLMSETEYLKILNQTKLDLRGLRIASSQSLGDI